MIKRVFGKLNGQEITFVQKSNGLWDVEIPKTKEGKYIVEVFAQDDAGNVSFFAKAFFEIDASCTCVNFKMKRYDAKTENDEYVKKYNVKHHFRNYELEVLPCQNRCNSQKAK